jgi:hypothetical protein
MQKYNSVKDESNCMNLDEHPSSPLYMSYLRSVSDATFEAYPGISHTREATVEFRRGGEISCLVHSVDRKKRELIEAAAAQTVLSPCGIEWEREFVGPM